ncbi:unnamed protein product [Rangifer tarandus platyrhynchus]|uniref:Uncharacterized protein n=3 Tax=Rangifer tarandus platyrhynchus TaxID=3082113 RepID=A0ABN8ZCA5_RANTA|nr:unnamed protein product [Rangifer tarandus platyrhynchus]CAI9705955.1 unnamed protein product [Rangifer tarandus platyrhynchus]
MCSHRSCLSRYSPVTSDPICLQPVLPTVRGHWFRVGRDACASPAEGSVVMPAGTQGSGSPEGGPAQADPVARAARLARPAPRGCPLAAAPLAPIPLTLTGGRPVSPSPVYWLARPACWQVQRPSESLLVTPAQAAPKFRVSAVLLRVGLQPKPTSALYWEGLAFRS